MHNLPKYLSVQFLSYIFRLECASPLAEYFLLSDVVTPSGLLTHAIYSWVRYYICFHLTGGSSVEIRAVLKWTH